jgi:hypothetical protein
VVISDSVYPKRFNGTPPDWSGEPLSADGPADTPVHAWDKHYELFMPEITRLSGGSDWINLDFVEREQTPQHAMRLGIQMHVADILLSNTIFVLDELGVQRSRKAVHDWVQKADLQPDSGASPNHVALDETVIRINNQQYWLYAAIDPNTGFCSGSERFPLTGSPSCGAPTSKTRVALV